MNEGAEQIASVYQTINKLIHIIGITRWL